MSEPATDLLLLHSAYLTLVCVCCRGAHSGCWGRTTGLPSSTLTRLTVTLYVLNVALCGGYIANLVE